MKRTQSRRHWQTWPHNNFALLVWKWTLRSSLFSSLLPNNEVHIDTWVKSELSDLLNGGRGAIDVNYALVDAHLEAVPGVGTVAARGSACRDDKFLGGDANGSLDLVVELLGLGYDLGTCVLQGARLSSSESHANKQNQIQFSDVFMRILWISSWISSPFILSLSASIFR